MKITYDNSIVKLGDLSVKDRFKMDGDEWMIGLPYPHAPSCAVIINLDTGEVRDELKDTMVDRVGLGTLKKLSELGPGEAFTLGTTLYVVEECLNAYFGKGSVISFPKAKRMLLATDTHVVPCEIEIIIS